MKPIPVQKDEWSDKRNPWIDYKDQVLIIKQDDNQKFVRFQFDGVMCAQGYIRGLVFKSFKTKCKWFNPEWWYKRTSWSMDPLKIYFDKPKLHVKGEWSNPKYWEELTSKATALARPSKKIIDSILKEVNLKTKSNFEFDGDDLGYGHGGWYESNIKIKDKKGNKYLLTWENCD